MVKHDFKINDVIRVAKPWANGGGLPRKGDTATITGFQGSYVTLRWDRPFQYSSGALFDLTPWFEPAEGPW